MTTANLQVIASPEYPLTDNGRKRLIYILAAFFGSLIFISGYFLLIELLTALSATRTAANVCPDSLSLQHSMV